MTRSWSYTFATLNASPHASPQVNTDENMGALGLYAGNRTTIWWRLAWCAIFLVGVVLRLLRLSWQPLWWDEGYSVYFASEPLPTMRWLTAQDIHPPLYYTLLHFWFNLLGNTGPETARLFSVLIGIATLPAMTWASLTLWPQKRGLALIATLLLAISPIHLYYSQEIRMYGLALLLTLLASTFLWCMQQQVEQGKKPYALAAGYVITASLALLTLYYTGFLLLAHQIWTLAINRHHWRRQLWFLAAALFILLIQLPWWLYAFPKLFTYVADKVIADQDTPLPIWSYIWRHWLAFFTGHLPATQPWLETVRQSIAALIALMLAVAATLAALKGERRTVRWLLALTLIPLIVGFAVNLAYPFFPEGGERLLLQILPYLLLLFALLVVKLATAHPRIAATTITLPLIAAAISIFGFFTNPRYVEHDYRPIIATITQQSRPNDTILALFPWQVGYWRAYSPRDVDGSYLSPQPTGVDQTLLRWDETFEARLDDALTRGTIWFPMPLSFGSTLPVEIEDYLKAIARNLENFWYSPATRLTAWVQLDERPTQQPINASFQDQVTLISGGVSPSTLASANIPLAIDLCWQPPAARDDLRATLRLLDSSGYVWAARDLTPLAAYTMTNTTPPCLESVALNIPVGLPPASYQLMFGVGPEKSNQLFTPAAASSPLLPLGEIIVTAPNEAISPHRLPIEYLLPAPLDDTGLLMLGYSGPSSDASILAGDELAITIFLQNTTTQPPARDLYVSLLDKQGYGVAGWQGWPLSNYPTNIWTEGALTQIPIHVSLPPNLTEGRYTLTAGFVDPTTDNKSAPATLNRVQIIRRPATFTLPTTQFQITPPAEFGTHATLVGYDLRQEGATLQLSLTWQILQPLLPPHHIFIHLYDAVGNRIAQSDGDPMTAAGRAPSGSWLPGEYLTTQHTLTVPENTQAPFTAQMGLYNPATGQRLPVTINGASSGDSATISLPTAP